MKCFICNNKFYIKRGLSKLLSTKNIFICDSCYNKYKININYDVIPLNKHMVYIYSLFDKEFYFKNDPFVIEFSRLFEYVLQISNCDNVIVYKNLRISKKTIKELSYLSELIDNDLYIVCNYHEA